jgi:hypothetical protein
VRFQESGHDDQMFGRYFLGLLPEKDAEHERVMIARGLLRIVERGDRFADAEEGSVR